MQQVVSPCDLKGKITVPASKSDAQRALLAAALAKGKSTISAIGESDDVQMMLRAIGQLGATTQGNNQKLVVEGVQQITSEKTLMIGESGLGARLLIALAAVFNQPITIDGTGSLLQRSMAFYESVLPVLGATIQTNNGLLPVKVRGPIKGRTIAVNGAESSQTISGLLFALSLCEEASLLTVTNFTSQPYVQMTVKTLAAFGINIQQMDKYTFRIPGGQVFQATNYTVESDWSAASYWLVAAAIGHPITIAGLDSNSLQADRALLDVFTRANIAYNWDGNDIAIDGTKRTAFEFDATDCPDLFPALVVLALYCKGTSIIKGTNRLRNKESDRATVLVNEFSILGAHIYLEDKSMFVVGTTQLTGGKVRAHNDHRIAMSLAIAATRAAEPVEIDEAESVSKSYPQFWEHLKQLTI